MHLFTPPQSAKSALYNLFPVEKKERKKVLILCALKVLFSIAYTFMKLQKKNIITIDHATKDLPYVKFFVLPTTILAISLYTALSNRFSQRKLFYGILYFFISFLTLYACVLVPFREYITPTLGNAHPHAQDATPSQGFLLIVQHWIKVLFYCMSELFAQFFIIIFFWGIANELFTREQAKRLYHLFIIAGCLASMMTSMIKLMISKRIEQGKSLHEIRTHSSAIVYRNTQIISFIVIAILLLVLLLYTWILRQPDVILERTNQHHITKKKMSFVQSLKHIAQNPYLLAATVVIGSCALTTTLVETTYEKYLKEWGKKIHSLHDQVHVFKLLGANVLCIFGGLLLTQHVSRRFSWRVNASIPPIVVMITGVVFFLLSYINYHHASSAGLTQEAKAAGVLFVLIVGTIQNAIATFVRYVFFDASKEIIFIKLDPQTRKTSKGAVDVVASRFGKGLSSLIHITLFSVVLATICGESNVVVEMASLPLLVIFSFFCLAWLYSVRYLAPYIDEKQHIAQKTKQPSMHYAPAN